MVLVLTPLSSAARVLLFGLTLVAAYSVIRQVKFLSSVTSFHFCDDQVSVSFGEKRVPVEFVGGNLISGVLTVFSCRPVQHCEGVGMFEQVKRFIWRGAMHFVILPDALAPADYHALRLRLKASI